MLPFQRRKIKFIERHFQIAVRRCLRSNKPTVSSPPGEGPLMSDCLVLSNTRALSPTLFDERVRRIERVKTFEGGVLSSALYASYKIISSVYNLFAVVGEIRRARLDRSDVFVRLWYSEGKCHVSFTN